MCCSFISEPRYGQAFGAGFSGTAVSNEKKIRLTAADELRRPDRFLPSARVRLYLADHGGDILLHKAAKKAFDELGVKKLPSVKSLQEEYAKLLAEKRRRMPNTGVRAMRCASCCSTSRTWIVCWARMSVARKRNRSMIASNGHAPKAFRRNAQPHIYVCSKGFRGAAPDKQRAVFAAAEIARKAKWVPLCPACHVCYVCYVCKFGLKITLLS